jgi:hypothetical protein
MLISSRLHYTQYGGINWATSCNEKFFRINFCKYYVFVCLIDSDANEISILMATYLFVHRHHSRFVFTKIYIPFMLYPRRGSKDISGKLKRHQYCTKIMKLQEILQTWQVVNSSPSDIHTNIQYSDHCTKRLSNNSGNSKNRLNLTKDFYYENMS